MTVVSKIAGIFKGLRKPGSATPAGAASDRPLFAPYDPTRAFFPDKASESDEFEGAPPLTAMLEESARAMVQRKNELRTEADYLAARIGERRAAEVTLTAQAVRVLIGLVWLGVTAWLYFSVASANDTGAATTAAGIPVADATVLIRTFLIVSAAGLGVAFAVGALTKSFGNADNSRIRADAYRLGAAIAAASEEFAQTLANIRNAMERRGRPADAVSDLSRAHLTALEAHAFFREIDFLSQSDQALAARRFRGFLANPEAAREPAGPAFLMGALIGLLLGALAVFIAAVPKPEGSPQDAQSAALAIMQYPWAAQVIVLGGVLYAVTGAVVAVFSNSLTEGVAAKARADALAALRDGFTAGEAPDPDAILHQIEDAVELFRARIGGGARAHGGANQSDADFAGEDQTPEWRRRDSSVKFVDAGFSPAPKEWRTDAYAKKFEAREVRGSGAKRGGQAVKNRADD